MRRYRGHHDGSAGTGPVSVVNVAPDGTEAPVGLLTHHVRHSPTGFSWGYGGSGPAELARCLLIDVLGDDVGDAIVCETCGDSGKLSDEGGECVCWDCDGDRISRLVGQRYQRFKFDVVARWGNGFDIGADEILAWCAADEAGR